MTLSAKVFDLTQMLLLWCLKSL